MAQTEAQKKAKRKYRAKLKKENPEKFNHDILLSNVKSFINNYATIEDIEALKMMMDEKHDKLQGSNKS